MSLHDGIGDESGRNLASTEPTTVEPLDSLLCRVDGVEFDVNFTLLSTVSIRSTKETETCLRVPLHLDLGDFAVFSFTFTFDIVSKIFIPIWFCFSESSFSTERTRDVKRTRQG